MSRKLKVLSLILVAVLLLTIGGATVALAQEEEQSEPQEEQFEAEVEEELMPPMAHGMLLDKVAGILGITEEELKEAFAQAREEMMEERCEETFYQLLDKAVEEGLLTEEEAEEIREWWEQRPEALSLGLLKRAFGHIGPRMRNMPDGGWKHQAEMMPPPGQGLQAWHGMGPEACDELLEKALDSGRLTQEQADKLKEWLEKRPEAAKGISPRARIFSAMRGRHMMAGPRAEQEPELGD